MLTVVTSPTTNDLTTTDTAQTELRLLREEDIAGLAELVAKASQVCATYCNRPEGFGKATVRQTERLTATRECIILERDLNPAITSVVEGADTLTSADYELDGALLYRLDDDERIAWPAEKIVVTYQAGYTLLSELPRDIEQACLMVCGHLHAQRGRDTGVRREDDGLVSTSYMDSVGGLPPAAAALLNPWRRIHL